MITWEKQNFYQNKTFSSELISAHIQHKLRRRLRLFEVWQSDQKHLENDKSSEIHSSLEEILTMKQASQQGTIFGVATQHLLHLAADRRVYLMLILHLRVSSSDSSEVERLASILGDPRSIPPISKNIFVGNWAWFGLAILLSNSASSQNKAPCWEVC